MAYTKTVWVNNSAPYINASNLNKIENGIEANDLSIGDMTDLETTATDLVGAVNEVKGEVEYNLVTDGPEVKTGRKIDGYDEYIRRYSISDLQQGINTKALGFSLGTVMVTKIAGTLFSNSNNWFDISLGDFNNTTNFAVKVNLQASDNTIVVECLLDNWQTAYIEISYIYRS